MILNFQQFNQLNESYNESDLLELSKMIMLYSTTDSAKWIKSVKDFAQQFNALYKSDLTSDISKLSELIEAYASDDFDFCVKKYTAKEGAVYQHSDEFREMFNDGWEMQIEYFKNKSFLDEEDFEVIWRRNKILQHDKLRDFNRNTGVFESYKDFEKKKDFDVKINDKYWLSFWYDWDEECWGLSLMHYDGAKKDENLVGVTFAVENLDEDNEVEICDYGLVPGQELTEEEILLINKMNLTIGQKFKNMEDVFTHLQLSKNKKLKKSVEIGILESFKSRLDNLADLAMKYRTASYTTNNEEKYQTALSDFVYNFFRKFYIEREPKNGLNNIDRPKILDEYLEYRDDYDFLIRSTFDYTKSTNQIYEETVKNGWEQFTFSVQSKIRYMFFKRLKLWNSDKIRTTNDKTGIFEGKYTKTDVDFRDVYNTLKGDVDRKTCATIADELRKAGLKVEQKPEMFYDIDVEGVPMQVVNYYELVFDNERIWGNKATRSGSIRTLQKPNKGSFADQNPEVFKILNKHGVDSTMGGPKFRTGKDVAKFFQDTTIYFYMQPKVKQAGKYGIWDTENE